MRLRAEGLTTEAVAHVIGCSTQTAKNHCSDVLRDLDVDSTIGAMRALGWLNPPGEPLVKVADAVRTQCGAIERCGRWAGHRGHHGGFRPVAEEDYPANKSPRLEQ